MRVPFIIPDGGGFVKLDAGWIFRYHGPDDEVMTMQYLCAPMEGVTGDLFRQAQRQTFPAADSYYTPFLSPTANRTFSPRELREIVRGGGARARRDARSAEARGARLRLGGQAPHLERDILHEVRHGHAQRSRRRARARRLARPVQRVPPLDVVVARLQPVQLQRRAHVADDGVRQ